MEAFSTVDDEVSDSDDAIDLTGNYHENSVAQNLYVDTAMVLAKL
jgi:hypothetical protein